MIMDKIRGFVGNPITQLVGFIFTIGGSFISNIIFSENFWTITLFIGGCVFGVFICLNIRKIYKNREIMSVYTDTLSQCAKKIANTKGLLRNYQIQSRLALKPHLDGVCDTIRKGVETLYFLLSRKRCSFAVCIKEIITSEIYDGDPSKWSTLTIARACDNLDEREILDNTSQKVIENTSFYETITLKDVELTPWTSRNLEKTKAKYKEAKKDYVNPDPRCLDFYKSTIVVPIKQKNDLVSQVIKELGETNSCGQVHYLGFLCIDSLETFNDKDKNFEVLVIFATVFAQLLYPFFEEYLVDKIQKVEEGKQ